jgi:uncharacterized membrane protein
MLFGVLGFIVVIVVWSRLSAMERRLRMLEQSLAQWQREALTARKARETAAPPVVESAEAVEGTVESVDDTARMESLPEAEPVPSLSAAAGNTPEPVAERTHAEPRFASAATPPPQEAVLVRLLKDYFTGGNLVVRVGIIVLFFGIAFLLKYAAEHSRLPIEARLIGVAVGAMILFVVGWRVRERRRGFSLALQGGAVGALYLTVFSAFRLYHLVPAGLAFGLLVVIGVASALLALKQDSLSFAMLGSAGGFLAPVLASTGQGNHVVLFSYYALLDAGIVAMAGYRAWRPLNLLAFIFTFAIGTLWGVTSYRPEQFASTEPFLVFYFLAFIAVAVLFAWRRAPQLTHYVDGTLVFGTPVIVMGLQFALVRDIPYGRAFSALAASAVYLVLAWGLYRARRDSLRLLVESFLALGIALLTLAVPLALDGHWTAATWALEGLAIFWMGLRQNRWLACASGAALQVGAGVGYVVRLVDSGAPMPVVNTHFLGALFVAAAGLVSARLTSRPSTVLKDEGKKLSAVFLTWGLGWWLYAGYSEIDRFVSLRWQAGSVLALCAVTAGVASNVAQRLTWTAMRVPALLLLPVMVLAVPILFPDVAHPFSNGGWVAWPLSFAVLYGVLHQHGEAIPTRLSATLHVMALWLLALLGGWELLWQVQQAVPESELWSAVAWALPAALLLWVVARGRVPAVGSGSSNRSACLHWGGLGLAAMLLAWALWVNASFDGAAAPLPHLPLLNPLDVAVALVLLLVIDWARVCARDGTTLTGDKLRTIAALVSGVAFLWLNGVLLRAMHQWLGVDYRLEPLLGSTEVQTALSIFWTILALGAMLWANRYVYRVVWFGGATLMGVVVIKLFLVDLARIGTVPRIVSFLGVGVLMLVIGYFSPLPPAIRAEQP